ncbi:MAG: hypothetical protein ACRCW3_03145 [Metamycoplasmataceae bacterium]
MISNLKKLALGIMSTGGILVPLAVVASCGTTDENIDLKITAKDDPIVTEKDIDDEQYKTLETLQKLFNGITASNLENLIVTKDEPIDDRYAITLTAKDGYLIEGQRSLKSVTFELLSMNLIITNKTIIPIDITLTRLEDATYIKTSAFLNKLFNLGTLTEIEIDNKIKVEYDHISGIEYKIILTSKSTDIKINGQETHESLPFNIATNIEISNINPIIEEISTFDILPGNLETLKTLRKIFHINFEQEIIDNGLIVTFNEVIGDGDSITLTAKPGYIINDEERSIQSEIFSLKKWILGTPRTDQLAKLNEDDINQNLSSFKTVNNFFEDITPEMIDNDLTVRLNPLLDGFYTITLRANDNNLFLDGREITSIEFKVDLLINITPREALIEIPTLNDVSEVNLKTVNTLSKLFNNVTEEDLDKMDVEIFEGGGQRMITLRAIEGYLFKVNNNTQKSVASVSFVPQP